MIFNSQVGAPDQVSWSVDGGFVPPEQLWEDAQVGFEQRERKICFGVDDPTGEGRGGVGREAVEAAQGRWVGRCWGRGLPLRKGINRVRKTRSVQGCKREERSHFTRTVQKLQPVNEPRTLRWQGKGWCVLLSALHTQSSPGLAAPAACTDRPALLKDEGSDSCPPGVSSQLAVQRSPFFLLLFTPCKEFSINKRNCFIINLMFIPSPGV